MTLRTLSIFSLGGGGGGGAGVGDWIGVVCNVLFFMNHYAISIFMHNGLGLWMVHMGSFVLHCA